MRVYHAARDTLLEPQLNKMDSRIRKNVIMLLAVAGVGVLLLLLVSQFGGGSEHFMEEKSSDEIVKGIHRSIDSLKIREWSPDGYIRIRNTINLKFKYDLIDQSTRQQLEEVLKNAYSLRMSDAIKAVCRHEVNDAATKKALSLFEKELVKFPNGEMTQLIADYRSAFGTISWAINYTNNSPYSASTSADMKEKINLLIYRDYLKENVPLKELADTALDRLEAHAGISKKFEGEVIGKPSADCSHFKEFPYYYDLCDKLKDFVQFEDDFEQYEAGSTRKSVDELKANLQVLLRHQFFTSQPEYSDLLNRAKRKLN